MQLNQRIEYRDLKYFIAKNMEIIVLQNKLRLEGLVEVEVDIHGRRKQQKSLDLMRSVDCYHQYVWIVLLC